MRHLILSALLTVPAAACSTGVTAPASRTIAQFQTSLDLLRAAYHVPGMSVIVDGPAGIVWQQGFGLRDISKQSPVTPQTAFHLASLTKPFAAVIAMQLVQEGLLDLNAPASRYGITLTSTDTIRLVHLLSHTSEANPPGSAYHYSGNRYGMIESALTGTTSHSFTKLFDARIRAPLGLASTAPNPRATTPMADFGSTAAEWTARLAQGYDWNSKDGYQAVAYETYFGPAAGMISTPSDIVRFSRALDDGTLLNAQLRARMWTPAQTAEGRTLPYAIGWFVQEYEGETVLWHYGLWTGASALIIKVPARRLTYVVLANSPNLSNPFPLGNGDITVSPFALIFLKSFVKGPLQALAQRRTVQTDPGEPK